MRTVEQIRERYKYAKEEDTFGFATSDLAIYLQECLVEGEVASPPPSPEEATKLIVDYLPFAFEKAVDHRGLSANRSVLHLINYAWLAERDDLVAFAEADDNYPAYGVPILKRFAEEFKVEIPPALAAWENGRPCRPDCEDGCST